MLQRLGSGPTRSERYRVAGALSVAVAGLAAILTVACGVPTGRAWGAPAAEAAGARLVVAGAGAAEVGAAGAVALAPQEDDAAARPATTSGNALPEYVGPIAGRFLAQWFHSAALDRDMRYFIYLPPAYDTTTQRYPVLYLLHGASGEAEEWPAYGFINQLDAGINSQVLHPFIAVLPEGEFGYWINHADDGARWGDYVTFDVVGDVDAGYRTLPYAGGRAIGGLSMGGTGGLVQAFTYPGVFGVVGAHSPSLREDNSVVPFLGEGVEFAAHDPLSLARTRAGLDRLRIWVDSGEEDQFYPRALALHGTLVERGITHEWHPWPGEHQDTYWIAHTPDYLSFYSRALTNG